MDKADLNVKTGKTYSDLEPIDAARCQAEITTYEPMHLGGNLHPVTRCSNKPTWMAFIMNGQEFGGAMSLCDECKKHCEKKVPNASYQRLQNGESK
jgi:hypothetical protein